MLFTFPACIVNVIENSLHCPARVSLYLEDAKRLAPIFCEDAFWQSLCIYDACDIYPEWVIEMVRKRTMQYMYLLQREFHLTCGDRQNVMWFLCCD